MSIIIRSKIKNVMEKILSASEHLASALSIFPTESRSPEDGWKEIALNHACNVGFNAEYCVSFVNRKTSTFLQTDLLVTGEWESVDEHYFIKISHISAWHVDE